MQTATNGKRTNGANWRNPGFSQTDRHPVALISWNDAKAFAEWINRKSGKAFRLPTEAEWEYAARSGGKDYKYSWGNGEPSGNIAGEENKRRFPSRPWPIWSGYDDGYVYTAPVGSYKPNKLGLYDMTGNVWEWVNDWYDKDYYKSSPRNNPSVPNSGSDRVLRGGSWSNGSRNSRSADRFGNDPDDRDYYNGFRLARTQ